MIHDWDPLNPERIFGKYNLTKISIYLRDLLNIPFDVGKHRCDSLNVLNHFINIIFYCNYIPNIFLKTIDHTTTKNPSRYILHQIRLDCGTLVSVRI